MRYILKYWLYHFKILVFCKALHIWVELPTYIPMTLKSGHSIFKFLSASTESKRPWVWEYLIEARLTRARYQRSVKVISERIEKKLLFWKLSIWKFSFWVKEKNHTPFGIRLDFGAQWSIKHHILNCAQNGVILIFKAPSSWFNFRWKNSKKCKNLFRALKEPKANHRDVVCSFTIIFK